MFDYQVLYTLKSNQVLILLQKSPIRIKLLAFPQLSYPGELLALQLTYCTMQESLKISSTQNCSSNIQGCYKDETRRCSGTQ